MSEERCWILRSKLVSVSRISRKWNVSDWRLNDIIERYHLNTYSKIEDRVLQKKDTGEQEPFSYCNKFTGKLYENYGTVDKQGLYFSLDDVQECERVMPFLTAPVPKETLDDLEADFGEAIPAERVRQWLNMSPLQFVEILNSGKGPRIEKAGLLSTDDLYLSDCRIYIQDIEEWLEKNQGPGSGSVPVAPQTGTKPWPFSVGGHSVELEQARAQISELTKQREQATARADFLEREKIRKEREIEDLKQQLAEKDAAQCQGQDSAQAEALQKVRSELEAEQAAHKKTRAHAAEVLRQAKISKEREITRLQEELAEKNKAQGQGVDAEQAGALKRLEEAIGMPEDWSHATERKYPPIVRVVGYRLQGKDKDQIAALLAGEKVRGTRNNEPVDVDCFTQSQIEALVTEDPIEELSIPQIGVLIDEGRAKAAGTYKTNGKRAIARGLAKSVPPSAQ